MRRYTLLLIGLIALAGCGPAAGPAPTPAPPPSATAVPPTPEIDIASTEAPPEVEVSPTPGVTFPPRITLVDQTGASFAGEQGSFCWPQSNLAGQAPGADLCADYFGPPEVKTHLRHPAGEPIEIRFEAPLPDSASAVLSAESRQSDALVNATLTLSGDSATLQLDQPPGAYILMVLATWTGQGDNSVFFGLTLE